MSSRGSGWIYIKFDRFFIKDQLNLKLSILNLNIFNKESIKKCSLEAQAGSIHWSANQYVDIRVEWAHPFISEALGAESPNIIHAMPVSNTKT